MNCSALSRRVALMLLLTLIATPALRSQAPDQAERRATVVIRAHGDAKLTVNDQATQQKGERRTFRSPPLEPGKKYSYTFVAEWLKPGSNYETYKVTRKV